MGRRNRPEGEPSAAAGEMARRHRPEGEPSAAAGEMARRNRPERGALSSKLRIGRYTAQAHANAPSAVRAQQRCMSSGPRGHRHAHSTLQ